MNAREAARALNRTGYDAIALRWDSCRGSLTDNEARLLDMALGSSLPDGRVVDLGCGTGRPVADLIVQRGLQVTGVDQSEGVLELARRRLPACEWVLCSIEQFAPTFQVACVVAWDSMFHMQSEDQASTFRKIRAWLAVGAPFLLTVGGSAGATFTSVMHGEFFFFDSPSLRQTQAEILAAGFAIDLMETLDRPSELNDRGRVAILAHAA